MTAFSANDPPRLLLPSDHGLCELSLRKRLHRHHARLSQLSNRASPLARHDDAAVQEGTASRESACCEIWCQLRAGKCFASNAEDNPHHGRCQLPKASPQHSRHWARAAVMLASCLVSTSTVPSSSGMRLLIFHALLLQLCLDFLFSCLVFQPRCVSAWCAIRCKSCLPTALTLPSNCRDHS